MELMIMIMNDTCATHRSQVPRRSSGRIKGGAMTVEDEREPCLDFIVFYVQQLSVRGYCFYFVFVYFIIKVFKCSPVPASFFPIEELCYNGAETQERRRRHQQ